MEDLIDRNEASKILAISRRTLDRMVAARAVPHYPLPSVAGKRPLVRFDRGELLAFLKSLRVDRAF